MSLVKGDDGKASPTALLDPMIDFFVLGGRYEKEEELPIIKVAAPDSEMLSPERETQERLGRGFF